MCSEWNQQVFEERSLTTEDWGKIFNAFSNPRRRAEKALKLLHFLRKGNNSPAPKEWFVQNRLHWITLKDSMNAKFRVLKLPYKILPDVAHKGNSVRIVVAKPRQIPLEPAMERPAL